MRAFALLMLFAPLQAWSARCEEPAPHAMVIANNRATAEAGLAILQAGGSAADAAVAVLMVMSVVEPQAAGIGGGAVLVHFDAASHAVTAWDGRETAPAAAIPALPDAPQRTGGRAVGVPGAVRMLEALHNERGHLPWADLLAPAIRLAMQGAPVSADLAQAIVAGQEALRRQKQAVFFTADGAPLTAGSVMTNPALAQTLRAIAGGGANALLHGPLAAEIATAARGDEKAGLLTTDDLAAYRPRREAPVCAPFRSVNVCTGPPPAGGLVLLQTLGLLDHTDLATLDPGGVDAAALLIQAEQLATADAGRYLADPDSVPVPVAELLADSYLARRALLIDALHAGRVAAPLAGVDPQREHGTSSAVIIDAQGNAVAMTASLGAPFGAVLFVHGFALNAALADFAAPANPGDAAGPNQIQPGKRPASFAAPVIVLDSDHLLVAAVGSTGGARMPAYEAQALAGVLAWHMDAPRAVAMPHVAGDSAGAVLEVGTGAATLGPGLADRGLAGTIEAMPSRTVLFAPAFPVVGAADPRGEGVAAGQ